MTTFADEALEEFRSRLIQLGANTCGTCGSEDMTMCGSPAVVQVDGKLPFFAFVVECSMCGHMRLFNTARFFTGDERVLTSE